MSSSAIHEQDEARKHLLSNRISEELRDRIVAGHYNAGDSLTEGRLAEEFGVSRTPIREALRQLEQEGLVHYAAKRGVIVDGISEQDIMEIYTIREMIEGLAARWAASRITPAELAELHEQLELSEFYNNKGEYSRMTALDGSFHHIVLSASKSKSLQHALAGFMEYAQRARIESLRVPGRSDRSLQEHRKIYEAIAGGRPAEAERLMKEHVMEARRNLLEQIKQYRSQQN